MSTSTAGSAATSHTVIDVSDSVLVEPSRSDKVLDNGNSNSNDPESNAHAASTSASPSSDHTRSQDTSNSSMSETIAAEEQEEVDPSSSTLDDIFGPPSPIHPRSHSGSNSQHQYQQEYPGHQQSHESSDIARLRSIHSTAGYRDGISAAREEAVQGGFDEGYLLGAAVGARVGVLLGLVDGIVAAMGSSSSSDDVVGIQPRVKNLRDAMRRDLALENVLGPTYVMADGSWAWDVDERDVEQGGILAVAEAHPLIRRYAAVVGEWVTVLGVRKIDERSVRDGNGAG